MVENNLDQLNNPTCDESSANTIMNGALGAHQNEVPSTNPEIHRISQGLTLTQKFLTAVVLAGLGVGLAAPITDKANAQEPTVNSTPDTTVQASEANGVTVLTPVNQTGNVHKPEEFMTAKQIEEIIKKNPNSGVINVNDPVVGHDEYLINEHLPSIVVDGQNVDLNNTSEVNPISPNSVHAPFAYPSNLTTNSFMESDNGLYPNNWIPLFNGDCDFNKLDVASSTGGLGNTASLKPAGNQPGCNPIIQQEFLIPVPYSHSLDPNELITLNFFCRTYFSPQSPDYPTQVFIGTVAGAKELISIDAASCSTTGNTEKTVKFKISKEVIEYTQLAKHFYILIAARNSDTGETLDNLEVVFPGRAIYIDWKAVNQNENLRTVKMIFRKWPFNSSNDQIIVGSSGSKMFWFKQPMEMEALYGPDETFSTHFHCTAGTLDCNNAVILAPDTVKSNVNEPDEPKTQFQDEKNKEVDAQAVQKVFLPMAFLGNSRCFPGTDNCFTPEDVLKILKPTNSRYGYFDNSNQNVQLTENSLDAVANSISEAAVLANTRLARVQPGEIIRNPLTNKTATVTNLFWAQLGDANLKGALWFDYRMFTSTGLLPTDMYNWHNTAGCLDTQGGNCNLLAVNQETSSFTFSEADAALLDILTGNAPKFIVNTRFNGQNALAVGVGTVPMLVYYLLEQPEERGNNLPRVLGYVQVLNPRGGLNFVSKN